MKLNWKKFNQKLYRWTVEQVTDSTHVGWVEHRKGHTQGGNIKDKLLLYAVRELNFSDFQKARTLVKDYNKSHADKYALRYERAR